MRVYFSELHKLVIDLGRLTFVIDWQRPGGHFVSRQFSFTVLWY